MPWKMMMTIGMSFVCEREEASEKINFKDL
jgi:hypothetical protein